MISKAVVDEFIAQPALALVGVSRSPQKFGNMACRELKAKGYRVYPVHPQAESLEGDKAYPDFKSLPEAVGGAWICVTPEKSEQAVREAFAAGIRRVWIQQGAESDAALQFCQENGIAAVHGECILMFAGGSASFPHSIHRWVWKVLGKLPK
jgi:hypothetical protein